VAGGRARITSDNEGLRPWRDSIVTYIRDAMERNKWVTTDGPVEVTYTFWLPRPESAPKTRDILPRKGADLDKLVRAANDALTNAGVWTDDSRVTDSQERKRYVVGPHLPKIYNPAKHMTSPGLVVRVVTLEDLG